MDHGVYSANNRTDIGYLHLYDKHDYWISNRAITLPASGLHSPAKSP